MNETARIWVQAEKVNPPPAVLEAAGGDALLADILFRRGWTDPAKIRGFLDPEEYRPSSPYELPGMGKAVDRILRAAKDGERVLIWGDFDVDGQTSTTILHQAFSALGINLTYHIPLRESEGHGVHLPTLRSYLDQGIQLVVTCDTGISEVEAAAESAGRGVDFIITDHHELPEKLPRAACAIVNPRLLPEEHPLASLPGCGVAYKLAEALLTKAESTLSPTDLVDLAALGIVADLAELRGDSRHLLQRGLVQLRQNRRRGLAELLKIIELDPLEINEEHLAFYLAPRLNALGRLADANVAVDFFTTTDEARAVYLAQELDGLNTRRKLLTDQVLQGALGQIEQHPTWLDGAVLVVEHSDWPGGVLGIVASQLVSRFHKPAILLQTRDGKVARGSARSVSGINITEAIASHQELLRSFGGHPMAAGLSMDMERVPDFRQVMNHTVAGMAVSAPPANELVIDAEVGLDDLSLDLADRLKRLSPFGQGNPAPVLAAPAVRVVQSNAVGKYREHLSLKVEDPAGVTLDAIWWQGAGQTVPEDWFNLAYTVGTNTFRGNRQVQVEWLDARPVVNETPLPALSSTIRILDYRGAVDPASILQEIRRSNPDGFVFAEGEARRLVNGNDRLQLRPVDCLVLYHFPAGSEDMSTLITQIAPREVILFGIFPETQEPEAFIRRLLGLMKFMAEKEGRTLSVEKLAAATAQRTTSVILGLRYLAARGELVIKQIKDGQVSFDWAHARPTVQIKEAEVKLEHSLAETVAFRKALFNLPVDDWRKSWFH
jgi:single-stranded-DNA-specific exonuclease